MRLNVGCNNLVLPKDRWVNIDTIKYHEDVTILDIRPGLPYPDESVEEIYGGNFFDHLTLFEGVKFLQEARRVLKPGCSVKFSLMDTDKIMNAYLYGEMDKFNDIQPPEYAAFREKSLKFAVFLLGNMAKTQEYTGHKMLYTPASIQEVGQGQGFQVRFHPKPDFTQEPWCVENQKFSNHVFYVELIK